MYIIEIIHNTIFDEADQDYSKNTILTEKRSNKLKDVLKKIYTTSEILFKKYHF